MWTDWEKFAAYAFNKSHSTCYAFIAYQTAYLKANYLPEFMAANLKHQTNIEKITQYIEQCKASDINVLGPDVNESKIAFAVNARGDIRFGLSSIKGIGDGPSQDILDARGSEPFADIYDFVVRVNARSINKKTMEALVYSGAFDCFNFEREAYFSANDKDLTFIEQLIRYAAAMKDMQEGSTMSLFEDDLDQVITQPQPFKYQPWAINYKLGKEKETIGLYASGHPLDAYKVELEHLCNYSLSQLDSIDKLETVVRTGGLITSAYHGFTKKGESLWKD